MGKVKMVIASVVTVTLVTGAAVGGLRYVRKVNQPEIMVAKVGSFTSDYYMDDQEAFEGYVSSNISQNVTVDNDMVVQEVYVSEGQEVHKGDKIVSFDMTLVEMELNIEKLKKELLESQKKTAEKQYDNIANGGSLEDSGMTGDLYGGDMSMGDSPVGGDDMESAATMDDMDLMGDSMDLMSNDPTGEIAGFSFGTSDELDMMVAYRGMLLASAIDGDGFFEEDDDDSSDSNNDSSRMLDSNDYGDDGISATAYDADDFSDGFYEEDDDFYVDYSESSESGNAEDGDFSNGDDFGSSTMTYEFYNVLTDRSVPLCGSGTERDPYVFLCSVSGAGVTAKGSFLNKMAGFTPDGTDMSEEGSAWYQLEFYKNDVINYISDRSSELIGVYTIDGAKGYPLVANQAMEISTDPILDDSILSDPLLDDPFLSADSSNNGFGNSLTGSGPLIDSQGYMKPPFDPDENFVFQLSVAAAILLERNSNDAILGDAGLAGFDMGSLDSYDLSFDREETLKYLKQRVKSLELDIRQSEIEIAKLEKKIQKQTIFSKLEGVVTKINNPNESQGSWEPYIQIKNINGFYVVGAVSELVRDDLEEDTKLKCSSYSIGDFNASVMEVSKFPVSNSDYMMFGSGNPNVSYYTFTAEIDGDMDGLQNMDFLTISPESEAKTGALVLPKSFVRTKNGVSYVCKDENGVLKIQPVKVEATVNYGYDVLITGGLKKSDLIAFPYGKNARDGVKTYEVDADMIYSS